MKKGTIWMSLGLIMLLGALVLTGYNLADEKRAEREAAEVIVKMEAGQSAQATPVSAPKYKFYADMEMPTVEIEGRFYIGTLEIPEFELKLPVLEEWNYPNLRVAPCRYTGSVYNDDMILAAHNYGAFFGRLQNLEPGDEVIFTDADGNSFSYEAVFMETLAPTEVEVMKSDQWDLTLFTCTYDLRNRVAVRCQKSF